MSEFAIPTTKERPTPSRLLRPTSSSPFTIDRTEPAEHVSRARVDSQPTNLYLRSMRTLPVKSERLAQVEEFARRPGKSTPDLEWERQDYQEAVEGVRQGLEDAKAGRTKPAPQVLEEFARAHEPPC
jgi:hypothetical protein